MSRKRNKLLIDRGVQGALIRRMLIHWFSLLFLFFALMFVLNLRASPNPSVSSSFAYVWNDYGSFFLLMIVLLPAVLLDTVKLSNRFVGPIVHFRKAINQLVAGDKVEKLRFRGRDFWHDISDGFNQVIDRIESLEYSSNSQRAR